MESLPSQGQALGTRGHRAKIGAAGSRWTRRAARLPLNLCISSVNWRILLMNSTCCVHSWKKHLTLYSIHNEVIADLLLLYPTRPELV